MRRVFAFPVLGLLMAPIAALGGTHQAASTLKPPAECASAKNAGECAGILQRLGKNPFDAYGHPGSEPIYGGQSRTAAPLHKNFGSTGTPPTWWATLILGFVLGLLGDPVKRLIIERLERRRAKSELYNDIGGYLARVEGFKMLTPRNPLVWVEITRPNTPFFDYYSDRDPALLLRVDKRGGICRLITALRALGDAYRTETKSSQKPDDFILTTFPDEVIQRYNQTLDSRTLDRKVLRKAYKRHREPTAMGAPLLI